MNETEIIVGSITAALSGVALILRNKRAKENKNSDKPIRPDCQSKFQRVWEGIDGFKDAVHDMELRIVDKISTQSDRISNIEGFMKWFKNEYEKSNRKE